MTVMNADGSDRATSPRRLMCGGVDWSPDGKSIVGGSDADEAGLFVLPLDGGTAMRLTKGFATVRRGRSMAA